MQWRFLKLKKENEEIRQRLLRDIRNTFEQEKEDYYKPEKVGNFWSNNYIEYEINSDRNATLLLEEYLNKIWPHLKDIKSEKTWYMEH